MSTTGLQKTVKSLLSDQAVKVRFEEMLGERAPAFISSIIGLMNTKKELNECEPGTVIGSCALAATLDLPINSSFGYCGIVPYRDTRNNKTLAQFQAMTRGFVQLGTRSGLYTGMGSHAIRAGQLTKNDPLFGHYEFDFDRDQDKEIIGFAGGFTLSTGMKKIVYMNIGQLVAHGKKWSRSYNTGLWTKTPEFMYEKTVLKQVLSKWGPLSVDYRMAKAIKADQAVIKDFENTEDFYYPDSTDEIDVPKIEVKPDANKNQGQPGEINFSSNM